MRKPQPYCIGWYHGHAVRIYRIDKRCWKFEFEPFGCLDEDGNRHTRQWDDAPPERTLKAAKNSALALAQRRFTVGPFQERMDSLPEGGDGWRIV